MSTSTALSFVTLPPTLQRQPIHDGRSDPTEVVKLVNQHRALASATYRAVFPFTTPGDGAAHIAWQAQLSDNDTWFATALIVATSSAGDGAYWRRDTLITRNGSTVSVRSDSNEGQFSTAAVIGFAVSWASSALYAQLSLADSVGVAGKWKVALEILRP